MPKIVDATRVTSKDDAVWRECACCGQLRPLPPDALFCDDCAAPARPTGPGTWSR
ncbi:hypothetical protein GCM10009835_14230 [Planosporangium flavigriseum]|uniref:Uncharacterized protein n=1 Tax=Planosporangium flavigriseum TaxID=373681 RepID=A0A8J3PQW9_9ACTN|nr:hypothetical protein Pfl04_49450 [Planosporangium flavigriseum]